jgi:hypothetical protein
MKNEIIGFLTQAGHSISGYEHQLLEKFATFLAQPVVEETPVVEEAPAATGINATEDK